MKLSKVFKLSLCFYLPVILFLINFLIFQPFRFYYIYPWLDIPMHFLGGAAIAFSFLCVLNKCKDEIIIKDKLVKVNIIVSLVTLTAVLWEFWEHLVNYLFKLEWYFTLRDTLEDLFLGMLGGLIVVLFSKSVTTTK